MSSMLYTDFDRQLLVEMSISLISSNILLWLCSVGAFTDYFNPIWPIWSFIWAKLRGLLFLFRDDVVLDRGISKGLSDLSFFQILTKRISSHEAHFIMRKTITVEINIYLFTLLCKYADMAVTQLDNITLHNSWWVLRDVTQSFLRLVQNASF